MQSIPVVHTTPSDYRNWYLAFRGHCDDLADFEHQLSIYLAIAQPVKLVGQEEDRLEVWAQWIPELEEPLQELLQRWSGSIWPESE